MSVTLALEDEIDISRGDMLASAHNVPEVARQFEAGVVWMSEQPARSGKNLSAEAHLADPAGRDTRPFSIA